MPELPEVETVVRQLRPLLEGRRVRSLRIFDPLIDVQRPRRVEGRRIDKVERLGKQVVLELGCRSAARSSRRAAPIWLCIHLRMTGRLLWIEDGLEPVQPSAKSARQGGIERPSRARLRLDRGALLLKDVRRFATMRIVERLEQILPAGLDPTSKRFTAEVLRVLLSGSTRQPIKPWLLRQDRLVGIGNIYASEALFEARIHPERPAASLTRYEAGGLRDAIGVILHRAIDAGGTTFSDFQNARGDVGNYQKDLQVYDREGKPCPVCGVPIKRFVQQQRATYYCPSCQTRRRRAKPA